LQGAELLGRKHFHEFDLHAGVFLVEDLERLRQEIRGDDTDAADAQLATMTGLGVVGSLNCMVRLREELLGILKENFPGFGQRDIDRVTVEQFHGDLVFKILDLFAERGAAHIQAVRRLAETEFLSHRHEIS
jgi:hypothetical protein